MQNNSLQVALTYCYKLGHTAAKGARYGKCEGSTTFFILFHFNLVQTLTTPTPVHESCGNHESRLGLCYRLPSYSQLNFEAVAGFSHPKVTILTLPLEATVPVTVLVHISWILVRRTT